MSLSTLKEKAWEPRNFVAIWPVVAAYWKMEKEQV